MPNIQPTIAYDQFSRNALRDYIKAMPAGDHVPADWESDTPHLLVVAGDPSDGERAVQFVTHGFPSLWMDDCERILVVCPALAAHIATWYSDDLVVAIDLGPTAEANREVLKSEVAPDLDDPKIMGRVEQWIDAAAAAIIGER